MLMIQILLEYILLLYERKYGQVVAYPTAAELSWQMQNHDMIESRELKLQQNIFTGFKL